MELITTARTAAAWLYVWLTARLDPRSEEGATAVEYGLMVGLIAAVIVATVAILGGQVRGVFCSVVTALNVASPASCPS